MTREEIRNRIEEIENNLFWINMGTWEDGTVNYVQKLRSEKRELKEELKKLENK